MGKVYNGYRGVSINSLEEEIYESTKFLILFIVLDVK